MPHDMFSDVTVRPHSVRVRRSSLVILSVAAHGAAIIALVIVPLFAADVLPALPRSVTFIPDSNILPVVPAAPAGRSTHPQAPTKDRTPGKPAPAPTQVPSGITEESDPPHAGGSMEPVGSSEGVPGGLAAVGVAYAAPALPPPPAPPSAPVRLHSGIRPPQKLVDRAPIYPPMAQQARVEGIVIVDATIDAHGNVIAVRVLKSIALLDQAALDAVKQWKYTPALLNGVPVPVMMTVTVAFKLR